MKSFLTIFSYKYAILSVSLISFLITSRYAEAQSEREDGSIFGQIIDSASDIPLLGASVNIIDTQKGAMADDNGEYTIKQVPPGYL